MRWVRLVDDNNNNSNETNEKNMLIPYYTIIDYLIQAEISPPPVPFASALLIFLGSSNRIGATKRLFAFRCSPRTRIIGLIIILIVILTIMVGNHSYSDVNTLQQAQLDSHVLQQGAG